MKILIFFAVICLISSAFSDKSPQLVDTSHCFKNVDYNSTDRINLREGKFINATPTMKNITRCTFESNKLLENCGVKKEAFKAIIDAGGREEELDKALEKCIKPAPEGECPNPDDIAIDFLICFTSA